MNRGSLLSCYPGFPLREGLLKQVAGNGASTPPLAHATAPRCRMSSPATSGPHYLSRTASSLLLVEDEPLLRALFARSLRSQGHLVLEAGTGWEALQVVERHPEPIELLLTDVRLPGLNGLDLAIRLLARRPGLRVLFLAGDPE